MSAQTKNDSALIDFQDEVNNKKITLMGYIPFSVGACSKFYHKCNSNDIFSNVMYICTEV